MSLVLPFEPSISDIFKVIELFYPELLCILLNDIAVLQRCIMQQCSSITNRTHMDIYNQSTAVRFDSAIY